MQNVDLAEIERRPERYWNIDGLPELMMGILWVVWGSAWLLGERIPRGGLYNAFWMTVPPLLALSGFVMVWATRALKARITFPRTGYVALEPPGMPARLTVAAVTILTAMILAAAIVRMRANGSTAQMATPILSVILSLAFLVAGLRQHAPQYLMLAGVAVALGIALGTRNAGWESVNWLFLLLGAAAVAVGGARLMMFVRAHPRAAEEA